MQLYFYDTSIGKIGIAERGRCISNLYLPDAAVPEDAVVAETPLLREAFQQLLSYLAGTRREFSLPLAPEGTAFMKKVWQNLCEIPYGQTSTYQEIALKIGNPRACRAVGLANNRNPIPIFIPCHRVIGKNGSLTGYGGGLVLKEKLLNLEKPADPPPG